MSVFIEIKVARQALYGQKKSEEIQLTSKAQ